MPFSPDGLINCLGGAARLSDELRILYVRGGHLYSSVAVRRILKMLAIYCGLGLEQTKTESAIQDRRFNPVKISAKDLAPKRVTQVERSLECAI